MRPTRALFSFSSLAVQAFAIAMVTSIVGFKAARLEARASGGAVAAVQGQTSSSIAVDGTATNAIQARQASGEVTPNF